MQISKNFNFYEFTKSETADRLGIDNTKLSLRVKDNIVQLVENILQPLRDEINCPIKINSGYRCNSLNVAVNGAVNSQHKLGLAADIKCTCLPPYEVAKVIHRMNLPYDQLILYPTFVHVSYSYRPRKQLLYNKSYNGPKIAN